MEESEQALFLFFSANKLKTWINSSVINEEQYVERRFHVVGMNISNNFLRNITYQTMFTNIRKFLK
ncbi:hypothetical protein LguiB_026417 [Lonicera macranthoides]